MQDSKLLNKEGYSLLEVMVASGIVIIFFLGAMNLSKMNATTALLNRAIGSKNRIISGIRAIAGMPASLRNSMRAMDSSNNPINPALRNCAGGTGGQVCQNNTAYPLVLYLPLVTINSVTGTAIGIIPVTAPTPIGTASPARFDTFGQPCTVPGANCPLVVSTWFTAQCAPSPLPTPSPSPLSAAYLMPANVCTVASIINVGYTVQLDPSLASSSSGSLSAFISPFVAEISTSVTDISGNVAF